MLYPRLNVIKLLWQMQEDVYWKYNVINAVISLENTIKIVSWFIEKSWLQENIGNYESKNLYILLLGDMFCKEYGRYR